MIKGQDEHAFIEEWSQKFKEQIDERVRIKLELNPDENPTELREQVLLEKLAAVYAGCVSLGERVKELESRLNIHPE